MKLFTLSSLALNSYILQHAKAATPPTDVKYTLTPKLGCDAVTTCHDIAAGAPFDTCLVNKAGCKFDLKESVEVKNTPVSTVKDGKKAAIIEIPKSATPGMFSLTEVTITGLTKPKDLTGLKLAFKKGTITAEVTPKEFSALDQCTGAATKFTCADGAKLDLTDVEHIALLTGDKNNFAEADGTVTKATFSLKSDTVLNAIPKLKPIATTPYKLEFSRECQTVVEDCKKSVDLVKAKDCITKATGKGCKITPTLSTDSGTSKKAIVEGMNGVATAFADSTLFDSTLFPKKNAIKIHSIKFQVAGLGGGKLHVGSDFEKAKTSDIGSPDANGNLNTPTNAIDFTKSQFIYMDKLITGDPDITPLVEFTGEPVVHDKGSNPPAVTPPQYTIKTSSVDVSHCEISECTSPTTDDALKKCFDKVKATSGCTASVIVTYEGTSEAVPLGNAKKYPIVYYKADKMSEILSDPSILELNITPPVSDIACFPVGSKIFSGTELKTLTELADAKVTTVTEKKQFGVDIPITSATGTYYQIQPARNSGCELSANTQFSFTVIGSIDGPSKPTTDETKVDAVSKWNARALSSKLDTETEKCKIALIPDCKIISTPANIGACVAALKANTDCKAASVTFETVIDGKSTDIKIAGKDYSVIAIKDIDGAADLSLGLASDPTGSAAKKVGVTVKKIVATVKTTGKFDLFKLKLDENNKFVVDGAALKAGLTITDNKVTVDSPPIPIDSNAKITTLGFIKHDTRLRRSLAGNEAEKVESKLITSIELTLDTDKAKIPELKFTKAETTTTTVAITTTGTNITTSKGGMGLITGSLFLTTGLIISSFFA